MTKRYVIRYSDGSFAGNATRAFHTRTAAPGGDVKQGYCPFRVTELDKARVFGNIANAKTSKAWPDHIVQEKLELSAEIVEVKLVLASETAEFVMVTELKVAVTSMDVYERVAKVAGITREEAKKVVLGAFYGQDSLVTADINNIDVKLAIGADLEDSPAARELYADGEYDITIKMPADISSGRPEGEMIGDADVG